MSPQDQPPADKRRAVRLPTDLLARIAFGGREPIPARITNLSETGIFVAVATASEVGESVVVEVIGTSGVAVGLVEGRVVWRVTAPPGAPMPSGVGIEVERLDKEWVRFCAELRRAQ